MHKMVQKEIETRRRKTREVMVGEIGVGGNHPIRIQSMTTSPTDEVDRTVEQIVRLAERGCEIVRVAVQGKKEAIACEQIKNRLIQKGWTLPIVADIHFYPPAAMIVAEYVDKVRINPGNFVDKRATFRKLDDHCRSRAEELEKIDLHFGALVEKCKVLKRSMRIGVNHGSLSDRIMNDYGDTPLGMVRSAIEFAEVCRRRDYHEVIFSMKSSNPLVMIQAYRLLVAEMNERGWDYPLHLGVTEVGSGEEGRVKSAVGIGSLLLEGLGDTIRVSLTEDPWEEIDPCRHLIQLAQHHEAHSLMRKPSEGVGHASNPRLRKVRTDPLLHRDGTVVLQIPSPSSLAMLQEKTRVESTSLADLLYCPYLVSCRSLQSYLGNGLPILTHTPNVKNTYLVEEIECLSAEQKEPPIVLINHPSPQVWSRLLQIPCRFALLDSVHLSLHQREEFFQWLTNHQLDIPTILIGSCQQMEYSKATMWVAAELGSLLQDGYGEGVLLNTSLSLEENRSLSFNLLQACRMRASKTEFIACPGCGRTQFDLQRVEEEVRSQTSHLPGVKIAIMGCVVNGPGEMADADFGYVGSRKGKVDLYVEKSCIERGIEADKATAKLIELIKSQGRWIDPPA